jgi:hypothetical protein
MGAPPVAGVTGSGTGLVLRLLAALDLDARRVTPRELEHENPDRVLLCVRHPLETSLDLAQWEREMQALRAATKPATRVVVHYDALVYDPRAELLRIAMRLRHPVSGPALTTATAQVIPARRHRRVTIQELVRGRAPDSVVALYFDLCVEAGPVYHRALEFALVNDATGALGPHERDPRRAEIEVVEIMARLNGELRR